MPISPVSPTPQNVPPPASNTGTSSASNNAFGFLTVANASPALTQAGEIDGGDASLLQVTLNDQATSSMARAAQLQTLASRIQASANALAASYAQQHALVDANTKLQGELQDAQTNLPGDQIQLGNDQVALTTANNNLTAANNKLTADQAANAPQATIEADQAAVATATTNQATAQTTFDAQQAKVMGEQSTIANAPKQIKANEDQITSIQQTAIPAIVAEITTTTAALKKAQQTNTASGQVVSAQLRGIFNAIDKFETQIQTQNVDQWLQYKYINDADAKQLQASSAQLANELSGLVGASAETLPASEITNAAVQNSGSRVKIPV